MSNQDLCSWATGLFSSNQDPCLSTMDLFSSNHNLCPSTRDLVFSSEVHFQSAQVRFLSAEDLLQ
jgi:hypothetical protein